MSGQNPTLIVRVAANLDELRTNLLEGKSQIETTTAAMTKLATSFSGDKLIQAAQNVTAAVNQIGGASKLTEAEQARVNATLEKALEKYRLLGKEAPAGMQKLADETRRVGTAHESLFGSVTKLAAAFGIAFSAAAVVNFSKELLNMGDAIVRVHDRTGLTIKEVQQFTYVVGQTGNTIEELTGAIGQMQNRLASGDKSAIQSVKELGINFQTLIHASPAQQLGMIATEIAKIPDPATRSAIAMDLFGKTGTAILPTLTSQFRALADAAPVMSEHTVRALDEAGDAMSRLGTGIKVFAAETVVKTLEAVSGLEKFAFWAAGMHAPIAKFNIDTAMMSEKQSLLTETVHKTAEELADEAAAIKKAEQAAQKWKDAFDEVRSSGEGWKGTLATMTPVVVESIKGYLEAGVAQDKLATVYGLTATQVKSVATALTEEAAAHKREQAAITETTKLWDEYYALRVEHGGTSIDIQIAQIHKWAADLTAQMKQAGTDTKEFYAALAATSQAKIASVLVDWDAVGKASRKSLEEAAMVADNTYYHVLQHSDQFTNEQIEHFKKVALAAEDAAHNWGLSFDTTLDGMAAKTRKTADDVVLTWQQAMTAVSEGKGTMSGTVGTADLTVKGRSATQVAYDTGNYFGPVVGGSQANPRGSGPDFAALGYRASGGPVRAGSPYVVGERGPELFVPSSNGSISPNTTGPISIYITQPLGTPDAIARVVGEALESRMRNMGIRQPSFA